MTHRETAAGLNGEAGPELQPRQVVGCRQRHGVDMRDDLVHTPAWEDGYAGAGQQSPGPTGPQPSDSWGTMVSCQAVSRVPGEVWRLTASDS